jgi:hypothetical protein
MSAASGAFGARAGFNQSGGGYLMIVSSINMQLNTCVPGSGSGGATNPPVITAVVPTTVNNSIIINGNDIAPLFATGRAVKDMGKSVVSAGRVFRKIAETTTPAYPGYATYYIETGFEGQNGDTPLPRVARFL